MKWQEGGDLQGVQEVPEVLLVPANHGVPENKWIVTEISQQWKDCWFIVLKQVNIFSEDITHSSGMPIKHYSEFLQFPSFLQLHNNT